MPNNEIKRNLCKLKPSTVTVLNLPNEANMIYNAISSSNIAAWQWNTRTCELSFTPNFASMLGYSEGKIEGDFAKVFTKLVPPVFAYSTLKAMVKNFYSSEPDLNISISLYNAEGELKSLIMRGQKQNYYLWQGTIFFSCYSAFGTHTCEAPFLNFFENSKQAVVVIDFTGRILNLNNIAKKYFLGADTKNIQNISYFFKGLTKTRLKNIKYKIKLNKKYVLTASFNNHNGLKVPWELDIRFANYHNKKCFVAVLNDIKDKMVYIDKLRQTKNLLENTVNGLPLAVYAVDAKTKAITFWNKTSELFFNKPIKDAMEISIEDLASHNGFGELIKADIEVLESGITTEINNYNYQNEVLGNRIFNTLKLPLFDFNDKLSYVLSVTTDDTERKLAEQALQKSQEKLAKANSVKDRLFSVIGHDLRGPVGNMSLVMKMLLDDKFDEEEAKEILSELKITADETYHLLEHLLTWARSQRGTVKPIKTKCDVTNMINHICELHSTAANNKQIKLLKELNHDDVKVWADDNMLDTVIRNLVSNALKFTPNNGTITIKTGVHNDNVVINIIDTGIGMDESELSKLFRADVHISKHGTNNEKGTGLGLLLCKDFVEINNGCIKATSIAKAGSTFTFTVPIAEQ